MVFEHMLTVFISALGGAAVALTIAAFLGKRFLDLQISKALEKYKFELDQKSTTLKTELSIYAHEQNVGLSRLDEQRSEAIKEIYELVTRWHDLYLEICKPNESNYANSSEKKQQYYDWSTELVKIAEEISIKVRNSAIFFQQSSYNQIVNFGKGALLLSCNFYDDTYGKIDFASDENNQRLFNLIKRERTKLREYPQDSLNNSINMLISEFRKLMKAERSTYD